MPNYTYECCRCGEFDQIRPISAREMEIACPKCGTSTNRVLIKPAYGYVQGSYLKQKEDEEIARKASRARYLKDSGIVKPDDLLSLNDKRLA